MNRSEADNYGSRSRGTPSPPTGHPLPRRTSPANSVTLGHHRFARDASLLASAGSGPSHKPNNTSTTSRPGLNSSTESYDTGNSDPKRWFDQSNENPGATFDRPTMNVDPPFFQKETDSSHEDKAFPFPPQLVPQKHPTTDSNSAGDYRSVIDDLTIEIQKLKEELRHYRQAGPDMLRKDKLFEIKIHSLPKRKKRELETTLRDFAASLGSSPETSSSQRQKPSANQANRDHMYSAASGSISKHAASSSSSRAKPVDSAYASMSTGANSSGASLSRPTLSSSSRVKSAEQKVESYLRDIPEGLYPHHMVMTDKQKKKLVVRRLEHLFTGKIASHEFRRDQLQPGARPSLPGPIVAETQPQPQQQRVAARQSSSLLEEPAREARILRSDRQSSYLRKKSSSRDNGSASNSGGDNTESGGNGNTSGGANTSPPSQPSPPEQRPTRPKDLDPDRPQVPSENMEYIRHLGLVPPKLPTEQSRHAQGVNPDAEGWVYLNLLGNLAQLHIINVTPQFVRSAVSEISTKFQLSPDGRKIRWRGGSDGTRFSSDSPGTNSQKSPPIDESDSSNLEKSRKKQKTEQSLGDEVQSGSSGNNLSKFGPQVSAPSDSFHYKPLFVHQGSPNGETSPDDTPSSFGPVEDSMLADSRWGLSSGTTNRRKRRHDGAIIYYSGAPFCTDLSGDAGDMSPASYMLSSSQAKEDPPLFSRPLPFRSTSGSSLKYKPLSGENHALDSATKMDIDGDDSPPGLAADSGTESTDVECELLWTNEQQYIEAQPLEPCGLGGVLPEDHFMVVVTTKRPRADAKVPLPSAGANIEKATEDIIGRLVTSSPQPATSKSSRRGAFSPVEIDYISGRIKRLTPVPLPPPAIFFPPFTESSSGYYDDDFGSGGDDDLTSAELTSRRANQHQSDDYPDGVDLTSGDEDGEDPDDEPTAYRMYEPAEENEDMSNHRGDEDGSSSSSEAVPTVAHRGGQNLSGEVRVRVGSSSAATAGGVDSGFSSGNDSS